MPMPTLPHDIIVDVFSRLPVKSLMRFRCACKPWRSLISDPQFVKMHLNRAIKDVNVNRQRVLLSTFPLQSIDYEASDEDNVDVMLDFPLRIPDRDVKIVGSCNGLICLVVDFDHIILWNPSSRDSKELPKPSAISGSLFNYGLGYDSSVDDYKAVRVARPATSGDFDKAKVEVFTLKSNSWRRIQDIHPPIILYGPGTLLNGFLHWFVEPEIGQGISNVIISFDLGGEKFQEVLPLPDYDVMTMSIRDFRVLGGYPSMLCSDYDDYIELWVMKKYGVKASWTPLLTISCETVPLYKLWFSPVCYSKNEEVLMDVDGRQLVMYNMKEDTFRNLNIHGDYWDWFEMVIYVESLVSPNVMMGLTGDEQCRAQPKRRKKMKNREEK